MAVFKVEGGHRLRGEITPQGAKNRCMGVEVEQLAEDAYAF